MILSKRTKTQEIVLQNNAFLNGDAVKVHFVKNHQLIMAEECYFF